MSTHTELNEHIGKICADFYPNCNYCTCFHICFPSNPKEEEASKSF